MTLEKAIEIIQDILIYVKPGNLPEEHQALNIALIIAIAFQNTLKELEK